MKKIATIISIFTYILCSISLASTEIPNTIRIGLSYGSSAVSSFTLSAPSGIRISDIGKMTGKVTFSKASAYRLEVSNESKSKIIDIDDEMGVCVSPVADDEYISYNGKEYRGEFAIFRFSDSDMTVVNILGLEEYLYGVVPKELSTGHPIEALKAQAVTARTYAIKALGKYEKWKFDITGTTLDQAYGGKSIEAKDTTEAVDQTEGEVVTYKGEPISTYYFSTSAGYTENSENVWINAYPYLVAVEDKYQSTDLPYSTWKVDFTAKELKDILKKRDVSIGDIIGLNVLKESPSNAVLELEFVGTKDTYSVTKLNSKSVFGTSEVRSQFFDVIPDNAVTVVNVDGDTVTKSVSELKVSSGTKAVNFSSNLEEITAQGKKEEKIYNMIPSAYTIDGKGWGHGVGMSQNGALGMAREGFTYEEILKWYYTGVKIKKLN